MKANTCILIIVFFFSTAFKPVMWLEESAAFSATVNGTYFELSNEQLYRGLLVNRAASMDGKIPSRTVISTSFTGVGNGEGRLVSDNIQFEIGYKPDKTGAPENCVVTMQYKNMNYHMVKELSKMNITSFMWEHDRKHFIVSVDFDCKMRSFGHPTDGVKDIALRGKMANIRITVPSWLAAKTN